MQVEPSTRFANRALDSGELFLRRRTLYPAELRAHVRLRRITHYSTGRARWQGFPAGISRRTGRLCFFPLGWYTFPPDSTCFTMRPKKGRKY